MSIELNPSEASLALHMAHFYMNAKGAEVSGNTKHLVQKLSEFLDDKRCNCGTEPAHDRHGNSLPHAADKRNYADYCSDGTPVALLSDHCDTMP